MLDFLNANSGAIIAIGTVISVGILAIYTYFTTRLWRATERQAQVAAAQAKIAKRQLLATERQLALAQESFAALSRPNVRIRVRLEEQSATDDPSFAGVFLRILGENFGSAPAVVTVVSFDLSPSAGGIALPSDAPILIPPSQTEGLGIVVLHAHSSEMGKALLGEIPSNLSEGSEDLISRFMWVHVTIDYNGVGSSRHRSGAQVSLMCSNSDSRVWDLVGVVPTAPDIPHLSDLQDARKKAMPKLPKEQSAVKEERREGAPTVQESSTQPPGVAALASRESSGEPL